MEPRRTGIALGFVALLASGRAWGEDVPSPPVATDVDEVSVNGTKITETGGSVHAVKDAQLRRFSYDDPHQVLLAVPGVYVRPEDGFGLRPNIGIRGAASDRSKKITIMEDGVLVGPAPYSAPAAYYFPMIDRMRTVRVFKGPASIVYGPHTVGGAIDLSTREIPSDRKLTYDLGGGSFGYNKQHVTFGTSDERFGVLVEGMRVDTSGFKELDGGGDTGFTRNEWMVKTSYLVDPNAQVQNEIGLKLAYSGEASNESYLGLTDADLRATPDRRYLASRFDRMDNHRTAVEVSHRARLSPKVTMKTTAYRHDFSRVWRKVNGFRGADIADVLANPGTPRNAVFLGVLAGDVDATGSAQTILVGPNDRRFISQGVQTEVAAQTNTGPVAHRITYGVRAHYDEIVRKHTQDGFVMTARQLLPDGRVTEVTADNKASTYALALYAVDSMTLGPVTITPGIRVEAIHAAYRDSLARSNDGATYQVVIPGASGYWAMTRHLGVLAGVQKGFSPVPPEQARTSLPEKSVNYEGGLRFANRTLRAEAIAFYNAYENLTDICTLSSGCNEANLDKQFSAGKARVAGAELFAEAEAKPARGWVVPFRASYTYTYTEFLSAFVSGDPIFGNVREGDEMPYVPAHQATGTVGVEHDRWGLNVGGTFVDAMWERAGRGDPKPGEKTDAYFLLDASAKFRVLKELEVYVNGRNLNDDRYIASRRPFGARPGAPRTLLVGLRGEF